MIGPSWFFISYFVGAAAVAALVTLAATRLDHSRSINLRKPTPDMSTC